MYQVFDIESEKESAMRLCALKSEIVIWTLTDVPGSQYGLADSLGMRLTDYYVKVGFL